MVTLRDTFQGENSPYKYACTYIFFPRNCREKVTLFRYTLISPLQRSSKWLTRTCRCRSFPHSVFRRQSGASAGTRVVIYGSRSQSLTDTRLPLAGMINPPPNWILLFHVIGAGPQQPHPHIPMPRRAPIFFSFSRNKLKFAVCLY